MGRARRPSGPARTALRSEEPAGRDLRRPVRRAADVARRRELHERAARRTPHLGHDPVRAAPPPRAGALAQEAVDPGPGPGSVQEPAPRGPALRRAGRRRQGHRHAPARRRRSCPEGASGPRRLSLLAQPGAASRPDLRAVVPLRGPDGGATEHERDDGLRGLLRRPRPRLRQHRPVRGRHRRRGLLLEAQRGPGGPGGQGIRLRGEGTAARAARRGPPAARCAGADGARGRDRLAEGPGQAGAPPPLAHDRDRRLPRVGAPAPGLARRAADPLRGQRLGGHDGTPILPHQPAVRPAQRPAGTRARA